MAKGDYRVRMLPALSGGAWDAVTLADAERAAQLDAARVEQAAQWAKLQREFGAPDARRERKRARFLAVRAGERVARPGKRERAAMRATPDAAMPALASARRGEDSTHSVVSGFAVKRDPVRNPNPADKSPDNARGLVRGVTSNRKAIKAGLLPRSK